MSRKNIFQIRIEPLYLLSLLNFSLVVFCVKKEVDIIGKRLHAMIAVMVRGVTPLRNVSVMSKNLLVLYKES